MRIFFIEDLLFLRNSLSLGLEKFGYLVDLVVIGFDGLSMVFFGSYDIIVLDCMLLEFDGMVILKMLRKRWVEIKVFILFVCVEFEEKVEGLLVGVDDYLFKFFLFEELLVWFFSLMRWGVINCIND